MGLLDPRGELYELPLNWLAQIEQGRVLGWRKTHPSASPTPQGLFGTRVVGMLDGMLIVLTGAVLFTIIKIEKQLRRSLVQPVKT